MYEFKIQNIEYLQTVKEKAIDRITISIAADQLDNLVAEELSEIIKKYPGTTKLYVQVHDPNNKNHVLLRSGKFTIDIRQSLISYIEQKEGLDYKIN